MKTTQHYLRFPLAAIAFGLLGFFLRRKQLTVDLDPATNLFAPNSPFTQTLTLTVAIAAAMFLFFLLRIKMKAPAGYAAAFRAPQNGFIVAVMTTAGFLFFAAFLLCTQDAYIQYLQRARTVFGHGTFPVVPILTAVLMLPAGWAALLLGKGSYRPPLHPRFPIFATFPAFASLAWLIQTYQVCSRNPVLAYYVWNLLGTVCTVLALYYFCAFAYAREKPRSAVFFACMGIVLNGIGLAELPSLSWTVTAAAFTLLLLAGSVCLLRNWTGPVWPHRMLRRTAQMPQTGRNEQSAEVQTRENMEGE